MDADETDLLQTGESQMHTRTRGGGALLAALAFALLLAGRGTASAQDEGDAARKQGARADINYEVQLYLLVTNDGADGAAKLPQALDGVVRQLKTSLPPADYRLAATFINRVKSGGSFETNSVGGSAPQGSPQVMLTPAFYQFALTDVRAADGPQSEGSVNVRQLRFSVRLPIQAADRPGVVQFQETGLNTQMSVREGEPTLVSTLNSSSAGRRRPSHP
jgi:hypothetical protein